MTEDRPQYLVIDQGGHATRVFIFDMDGRTVSEGWSEVTTSHPAADRVEHDAEALLTGIRAAVDDAVEGLETPETIVAAGLATQRSTIVCWDRDSGRALTPAISWQDTRNHVLVEALEPDAASVRTISGLPLSAHYGASKLRWCLDNVAGVRKAAASNRLAWGPLASFLLFNLLKEKPLLADPANASRTQVWDLDTHDWSDDLLALFGLPRAPLPTAAHTRQLFGHLPVADRAIPLLACTGDQSAVPFATGWPRTGRVTINAGTGAFIQRNTADQAVQAQRLPSSIIYGDGSRSAHTLEGTVNGAAAAIETIAKQLRVDPPEAFARIDYHDDAIPLFLNGIGGLGSPFWIPGFQSRFVGDGTETQKLQAVVESVLFLIQSNLEALAEVLGPASDIVLTGGLSREDFFAQGIAALSDTPVLRPRHTEATARGVAFLLSGKEAHLPGEDADHVLPTPCESLSRRYRRWQEAMTKATGGR